MRAGPVLLLAVLVVAGCAGPSADLEPPLDVLPPSATYSKGVIEVDVPVPVVLIGFGSDVAGALQSALAEHRVEHIMYSFPRSVLAPEDPHPPVQPHHVLPTARFEVHALELGDLKDAIASSSAGGLYLAREAEDAIVAHLGKHGLAPTHGAPTLVFLHLGSTGHAYRLQYETGYIDNVRVFGERHPILVMDTSAAVDPWVGSQRAYNMPLDRDGDVDALADATLAATEFRLLQAPLYPPTTKPCHAVTLLTAIRSTALATHLPGYADPADLVDVDNLSAAWEDLLGEGRVHVDSVFLELPADDPALELILRGGPSDLLRYWLDENWDTYWVAHEGCEAYVSLFIIGDATDSGVSGIAMYDVRDDRRLSWSAMNDMTRFSEEQDGAFAPIFYNNDASRERLDWLNFLYTHETGHLFGQRHPHDISTASGGGFDATFSSIWSAMSYQQDGKIPLFGAIDANNQVRNRAGFLLDAVVEKDPGADLAPALQHMGSQRWWDAVLELEALLYAS